MKKLSLLLSFVFVVFMGYSQNTAETNQTGSSLQANVAQDGTDNTSTVDQIGSQNYIAVDQQGESNKSTVEQNGSQNGMASIPTYGYVKQIGAENTAIFKEGTKEGATSNFSDGFIDQAGNSNHAELYVVGNYHNAIDHGVTQIQEAFYGEKGNSAVVHQSNFMNDMDVYQSGSENNVSGVTQGQYNQFFVKQVGFKNDATVSQIGDDNGPLFGQDWNTMSQEGDENVASVEQGYRNKFKMTQLGTYNTAKVQQINDTQVETYQGGNSNTIGGLLNCVITDVAIFDNFASMDAKQYGDNNKLYVSTAGALKVTQDNRLSTKEGNEIKYTQVATGEVELTQLGDKNLIWLKNTSSTSPMDVDVDQNGDNNKVALFENGEVVGCAVFEGAHLDVDQIGDNNSLNLNSTSTDASVDVYQSGLNNWASVIQQN